MLPNPNLDSVGGAYSAPPEPISDGEGARCPLPGTPSPLSALSASFLRVSHEELVTLLMIVTPPPVGTGSGVLFSLDFFVS